MLQTCPVCPSDVPEGQAISKLICDSAAGNTKKDKHLRRLVGKLTMWFLNRSDTNQAVQLQKQARSLKFGI